MRPDARHKGRGRSTVPSFFMGFFNSLLAKMRKSLLKPAPLRRSAIAVLGRIAAASLFAIVAAKAHGRTLEEKAEICGACHGETGIPQDKATPIIWGQQEGYLYLQLRDYKRGTRKNEQMSPIAEALERDEMFALAAYFSKKSWPDLRQPRAPNEVAKRALMANSSVGCTGCHLAEYQGAGTVPRLAGQSSDYLTKTIAEFRSRERANNPGMSDLMQATSEQDLAAVVAYLAGR
ncbi:MAG: c-type cytochrome [Hyphomicrobiales bacterium]